MGLCLDIGSGPWPKQDYLAVDPHEPEARVDARCEMWDLAPFGDGSVDAIWSSHALEHVPKAQVAPTLAEWHRVLRVGGLLQLEVPDLIWVCHNFLRNPKTDWNLDTIFGAQTRDGEFHQTGFTTEILTEYLISAGFTLIEPISIVWNHSQDTLHAEARK